MLYNYCLTSLLLFFPQGNYTLKLNWNSLTPGNRFSCQFPLPRRVNLSKYHTMQINNKKRDSREEISINEQGTGIESLDRIKLLSVNIDNKLNFSENINMTCKKANQRIGVLMRLKNLVPTVAKLHLFKAAILPHLTYCHLTWHFCRASDKRKLERTLERGLRAVFRESKSTYEELLKKANLKSLYQRRLQDMACLMG